MSRENPLPLCSQGLSAVLTGKTRGFPGGARGKGPACQCRRCGLETERDTGLIPGWGRSLGGGRGNPLKYSCLENPLDRGAWQGLQRVGQDRSNLIGNR